MCRALAAVDGRRCMREALARPAEAAETRVLAVGKAASAMTLGALDALGSNLTRALVISRAGHFDTELTRHRVVTCMTGGHPLPDAGSLAAGRAALDFARDVPAGCRVLLLVSGGASSLLEVPRTGVTLADLARVNAWALASGLPIDKVNALRRALSAVKGGRLLQYLRHAAPEGYALSDVPGDDPAVIGSGLLAATAVAEPLPTGLPDWLQGLVAAGAAAPTATTGCPVRVVGRLDDALDAAADAAAKAGLDVVRHPERLAGDASAAAAEFCARVLARPAGLHVAGGETTVRLPAVTGRGGRNQHFALAAAQCLRGRPDLLLLAVGTDGTDGNTEDAGALVDGETLLRAAVAGLDPAAHLGRADSGTLLAATGDLVHTGPTGTNVGDLVLALSGVAGHGSPLGADR
jgi:glycerate 2-kinase